MTQTITLDQTEFDSSSDPVDTGVTVFANAVKQALEDILNGVQPFDRQLFEAADTYQIINGILDAPLQTLITVSAESGLSDTLDTIGVSNQRFVILKAATSTVITISGAGNITTADGTSFTLSGNVMAMLWCQGSQYSLIGPGYGIQNQLASSVDPGSGDGSSLGYGVGSIWGNTTKDKAWMNLDATVGGAIWKPITPPKNKFSARASNTSVLAVGITAPTLTTNTSANVNDSTNTALEMQTTNVANNIAGLVSTTFNLVRPAHDPIFECYIKTFSAITTMRLWIGLTSADVTSVDSLVAASTKFIGFRFSTTASDNGFKGVLCDGSNQELTGQLNTMATSTWYKLRMRYLSASGLAYFSVNDAAEQSLLTYPPSLSTDMGFVVRCITTAAANVRIDFSSVEASWG